MAGPALEVASNFSRKSIDAAVVAALAVYAKHPNLWTAETLMNSAKRLGRFNAPTFISDLDAQVGGLPDHALRPIMGWLFGQSLYPLLTLDGDRWHELFTRVGYTINGASAVQPSWPILMFRGSVPESRDNWSWTEARDLAWLFANDATALHSHGTRKGKVWTAYVEPWRFLAAMTGNYLSPTMPDADGKLFTEYVIYTPGMTITEDPIQGRT